MILWPAGLAVVAVWQIFADPAIDYRLVVAGALLPDLIDGAAQGRIWVMHTLAASVLLLALTMLATRRRRRLRRRLLAVPIGIFLHLVLDGVWATTSIFWWPALGWHLGGRLPALEHGALVLAAEEVVGAAALAWSWRRFGLADHDRRQRFLRTDRLSPVEPG